jgi:phenylalanyl-tRNA synthetase beta chain
VGKLSTITDIYPNPIPHHKVEVKFANIDRIIGQAIPQEAVIAILEDLGIFIEKKNAEGLRLSVPMFKTDVTREADVIEEILRVYGYDNHGKRPACGCRSSAGKRRMPNCLRNTVADMLSSQGFNEIMNNSLTRANYVEKHIPSQHGQIGGHSQSAEHRPQRHAPDLAVRRIGVGVAQHPPSEFGRAVL